MKSVILFVAAVVAVFMLTDAMYAGNMFAQGILFTAGVLFVVWCVRLVRDVR